MHTAIAAACTCCREVDSCSVTNSSMRSSRLMPGDLRPAMLSAQQRCCCDPGISSGNNKLLFSSVVAQHSALCCLL
jgi:hypothetical protein